MIVSHNTFKGHINNKISLEHCIMTLKQLMYTIDYCEVTIEFVSIVLVLLNNVKETLASTIFI